MIMIIIDIMSIPAKEIITSFNCSNFKTSTLKLYKDLTPCIVIFPTFNVGGKIFFKTNLILSLKNSQLSHQIC